MRSPWLNEVSTEADRLRLMHSFFVTLSNLRAGVPAEIGLSGYHYQHRRGSDQTLPSIMIGQGFHIFMMALLQCFYPTLRFGFEAATFAALTTANGSRTSCMGILETRVRIFPG